MKTLKIEIYTKMHAFILCVYLIKHVTTAGQITWAQ